MGIQKEESKRRCVWNQRGQQTCRARHVRAAACGFRAAPSQQLQHAWHSAPSEGAQLQLKGRREGFARVVRVASKIGKSSYGI